MRRLLVLTLAAAFGAAPRLQAQGNTAEERLVIAVADSLLQALSSGDKATMTRLTVDSSVVGGVGVNNGVERLSLRSWASDINRSQGARFTERGFGATARVQDHMAQVWMPYDLYRGDKWSHCGVDAFTLMKSEGRWRVAALIYTIEQPPACSKHPNGPPRP